MLLPQILDSNLGWDLIKSLFNYFGLKDYISFWYYERFQPRRVRTIYAYDRDPEISGEEIFWMEVLTGKLLEGDKVQLYNFQISPWFPRKPGSYWTYHAALAREIAMQRHIERVEGDTIVFDVWGKTLMSELGGIGAVNLRKNRDNILITATASGHTERGIPIICSQQVWHEIDKAFRKDGMVEADLQGTIGSMPTHHDSFFLRSPGLPKIAVHVQSLLNVKLKASDSSIFITPWTIFESWDEDYPYGFTYRTHTFLKDDMGESIRWMKNYIDSKDGKVILTDFDEETNPLNAVFPLNGCIEGSVLDKDIIEYCQQIEKKLGREH